MSQNSRLVPLGLGVLFGATLIAASIMASAIAVGVVGAALSDGRAATSTTSREGATTEQRQLLEHHDAVARRHQAITSYATALADFRARAVRPVGDGGLNLGAAEAKRRDAVLSALVLECIDAVNWYNLAAASAASDASALHLPSHVAWATGCTP